MGQAEDAISLFRNTMLVGDEEEFDWVDADLSLLETDLVLDFIALYFDERAIGLLFSS